MTDDDRTDDDQTDDDPDDKTGGPVTRYQDADGGDYGQPGTGQEFEDGGPGGWLDNADDSTTTRREQKYTKKTESGGAVGPAACAIPSV